MMVVMLVKLLNEVDVISEVVVVISLSVGGLEVILVLVNVISGIVVNEDVVYV